MNPSEQRDLPRLSPRRKDGGRGGRLSMATWRPGDVAGETSCQGPSLTGLSAACSATGSGAVGRGAAKELIVPRSCVKVLLRVDTKVP